MSPLSNSVYSSVFTYTLNVLTRPYRHITTKASIELHHLICVLLDISVLIVRLWRSSTHVQSRCPYETNSPPFNKVSWQYDELCDNNASDNGLSLSASVANLKLILMLGNNAILVAYQINTRFNAYACDGTFCHIN